MSQEEAVLPGPTVACADRVPNDHDTSTRSSVIDLLIPCMGSIARCRIAREPAGGSMAPKKTELAARRVLTMNRQAA